MFLSSQKSKRCQRLWAQRRSLLRKVGLLSLSLSQADWPLSSLFIFSLAVIWTCEAMAEGTEDTGQIFLKHPACIKYLFKGTNMWSAWPLSHRATGGRAGACWASDSGPDPCACPAASHLVLFRALEESSLHWLSNGLCFPCE